MEVNARLWERALDIDRACALSRRLASRDDLASAAISARLDAGLAEREPGCCDRRPGRASESLSRPLVMAAVGFTLPKRGELWCGGSSGPRRRAPR